MDAAALLEIREFDLFHLAWRNWSGHVAGDRAIEKHFVDYMFHQRVPPWVRHFCRDVLARAEAGRLDRRAFGLEVVRRRVAPVRLDGIYVAGTLAVAFILYVILFQIGAEPDFSLAQMCEGGPGLRFFAGLTHALAGRAALDCGL
jgi:hypothetical protein